MNKITFDILCFGSVTLDIFITPDAKEVSLKNNSFMIPLGDKIKVTHAFQSCGGSAANTSIGFSKMGFRTGIIGFIGDDEAAQYITTILQKKNVNTNHLEIGQHGFSSFSVILNASNGQRTVFHHRNTQEDFDPRHIFNAKSNALYIGHLYGKSEDMLQAIPEWKSNNRSRIIAWNPGKTQFQKGIDSFSEIFPFIDVLVLNKEEAMKFSRQKEISKISQEFLTKGVQNLFITDGNHGAYGFKKGEKKFCPTENKKVVSTLGAGDAFSVGAITALLKKKKLSTQLLWGSKNAQSVIQKWGAQEGQLSFSQL